MKSKIPTLKSVEEEAEFWETHDSTEFEGEFVEVKLKVARPLILTLAVRLDARTIDQLATIGRKNGIGSSTLASIWVIERLEKEGEG